MSVQELKSIADTPTITTAHLMWSLGGLGIALVLTLVGLRGKRR